MPPLSKDATVLIEIKEPFSNPITRKDKIMKIRSKFGNSYEVYGCMADTYLIGSIQSGYIEEIMEGVNDHLLHDSGVSFPYSYHDRIFDMLPLFNLPNVNIHWYSGPEEFLNIGIDRGYFFSITPAISYSPAVKKTVLTVDIKHLLLESDGPVKYSGKDGTPAMIKDVLKNISRLKEVPIDELENQIYENTKKVFPRIF
ncbi:unnamed protein product [marine sediment metagenome]|uniref:Amidohydrolase-related domain-containing protein n=1 Tax=marine sediment metagenome TaxID=412755 RepID=X1EGI0_9ZZZZ